VKKREIKGHYLLALHIKKNYIEYLKLYYMFHLSQAHPGSLS
jgi:hypothetical protein